MRIGVVPRPLLARLHEACVTRALAIMPRHCRPAHGRPRRDFPQPRADRRAAPAKWRAEPGFPRRRVRARRLTHTLRRLFCKRVANRGYPARRSRLHDLQVRRRQLGHFAILRAGIHIGRVRVTKGFRWPSKTQMATHAQTTASSASSWALRSRPEAFLRLRGVPPLRPRYAAPKPPRSPSRLRRVFPLPAGPTSLGQYWLFTDLIRQPLIGVGEFHERGVRIDFDQGRLRYRAMARLAWSTRHSRSPRMPGRAHR